MSSGDSPRELARRFGLVTVEMLVSCNGCTANAALKQLRASKLHRFPLIHPRSYWAARPLGPQALPVRYAIACYCLFGQTPRHPVQGEFTCGGEALCSDGTQVEAVRVELGGTPAGCARKALRFVKRNSEKDLSSLRYVVITGTAQKADVLRSSINKSQWPFPFRVVVLPELWEIVAYASRS